MAKTKLLKGKKKHWHQILAPKLFHNQMLGESLVADAESLVGRTLSINLMNLSRDPRKSNINLTFDIDSIKDGKAMTRITGYEMIPATVKRLVKKGKNKIDLSFECVTSDNIQIRIKPLIITRKLTTGAILASLRKNIVDELKKYIVKVNFEDVVGQLLAHKIQMILKKQLKKVYPIRLFELRSISIVKKKKSVQNKKKSEEKEEIKEEKSTEEIKEVAEAEKKAEPKVEAKEPVKEEKFAVKE